MQEVVSGTGHRPKDLICKYERLHPWKMGKIKQLENYLIENKPKAVISGFALGWDNWLSYVAIKLNIPLWAYIPFKGQEFMWSKEQKEQYFKLLSKAEKVNYICESGYAAWKMHRRNEAMIKDSSLVLALWNPSKKYGGTWSAVAHASSVGKPIMNFWHEPASLVNLYDG